VRIGSLVRGCEEPVMGSLLERLEARAAAARTRVEALRAEMDRLAGQVAAEEELLRRLEITKETVIEVLAGGDDDDRVGVVVDPGPNPEGGVGVVSGMSRVGCRFRSSARTGTVGGGDCRWPTGMSWRWWPMPARCAPSRCARRWGFRPSPGSGGDADQAQAAG
jgi:hypothetical protein